MKLTIDLGDAEDVKRGLGLLNMALGHTGSVSAPSAPPAAPTIAHAPPPAAPGGFAPPGAPGGFAPPAGHGYAPPPAPTAPPVAHTPPPVAGGAMSQADFSAQVQAYAKRTSPKQCQAALAGMGFGKVSDVPAEHYAYVISAMNAS